MKSVLWVLLALWIGVSLGFVISAIGEIIFHYGSAMSGFVALLVPVVVVGLTIRSLRRERAVRNDPVSTELRPGDPYFRHPQSS